MHAQKRLLIISRSSFQKYTACTLQTKFLPSYPPLRIIARFFLSGSTPSTPSTPSSSSSSSSSSFLSTSTSTKFDVDLSAVDADEFSRVTECYVANVAKSWVLITGLPNIRIGSLLKITSKGDQTHYGVVLGLTESKVMAVCWNSQLNDENSKGVQIGDRVEDLGRVVAFPTSLQLFGGVWDPMGEERDLFEKKISPLPKDTPSRPIFGQRKASFSTPATKILTGITIKKEEKKPKKRELLPTGLMTFDFFHPIVKGTGIALSGPNASGPSSFASTLVNVLLTNHKMFAVYVVVGKKKAFLEDLVKALTEAGVMGRTAIISALNSDPVALQCLAPFAGATLADYVRDQKQDVLLVYDDLSSYAETFDQLSKDAPLPIDSVSYSLGRLLESPPLTDAGSCTTICVAEHDQESSIARQKAVETIRMSVSQFITLSPELALRGFFPPIDVLNLINRPAFKFSHYLARVIYQQLSQNYQGHLPADWQWMSTALTGRDRAGNESEDELDQDFAFLEDPIIQFARKLQALMSQSSLFPMKKQFLFLFSASLDQLDSIPLKDVDKYHEDLYDFIDTTNPDLLEAIRLSASKNLPLAKEDLDSIRETCIFFKAQYYSTK